MSQGINSRANAKRLCETRLLEGDRQQLQQRPIANNNMETTTATKIVPQSAREFDCWHSRPLRQWAFAAVRCSPFAICHSPRCGVAGLLSLRKQASFFIDFLSPFLVTCASHNIYCYMLWLPRSPASHIFCYFVSLRPFPVINCKLLLPFC